MRKSTAGATRKPKPHWGKAICGTADPGIGVCGDWCLGHRVENAFVSGLELALKVA
jgi:renalase